MEFEGFAGIAAPAKRALAAAGVTAVSDLTKFSEAEVASWHGIGPQVLVALRELLAERNLCYRNEKGNENG
jgi:hypothetical protein